MHTVLALALGQAQSLLASEPFISEVVAANDNSLRDDFGDSPDWIEIHNPSDAPLNLGGWGLSDDLSDPHKWVFPSVSIPPHEYLRVLRASKFCLAPSGMGFSTRTYESVAQGCVPLIIQVRSFVR